MLKTVSSITNAIGALNYKGTWNASSNTPTLADGTGAKGDYYVVSTAGTQTFGGVQLFFGLGDWIVYNGTVWQRVEGGSDGNFANVTLTSTDAGATAAPLLELYRDSASPAASDTLGEIEFNGEDSAGNKQAYGLIHASILSPTSTTEQGQLHFETATAGALTEKMIIGTNNLVINEIGAVFNVRIEGDTDANLFYTDATNDRIGVGTISPTCKFQVNGVASTNGSARFLAKFADTNAVALGNGGGIMFQGVYTGTTLVDASGIQAYKVNATDNNYSYGLLFSTRADGGDLTGNMKLDESGNLTIGGATATKASGTTWANPSDQRLKNNIRDYSKGATELMQVRVREWEYNGKGGTTEGMKGLGVIADEVMTVLPNTVYNYDAKLNADDKETTAIKKFDATEITWLLVKTVQEQQDLITILTARVAQLESKA